jgi:hypothetical protein
MTTPAITVFSEDFVASNGSEWTPSGEWNRNNASGYSNATVDIQNNQARFTPIAATAASTSTFTIMNAMAWKDSTLSCFEVDLGFVINTINKAHSIALLFQWDGSISSPNGYALSFEKATTTTTQIRLLRLINGVATVLNETNNMLLTGGSATQDIKLRVSLGFFALRYEMKFGTAFSTGDPGSSGFILSTDYASTPRTSGRIAIASVLNGINNTGNFTISSSDWVACDYIRIRRIPDNGPTEAGAPSAVLLTSFGSGADTTVGSPTYTTSTLSPAPSFYPPTKTDNQNRTRTWFAFVTTAGNVIQPTVTGCGLTWTSIRSTTWLSATGRGLWCFQGTGTPISGALTITPPVGTTGCLCQVVEVSGGALNVAGELPQPLPVVAGSIAASGTSLAPSSGNILTSGKFPDSTPDCLLIGAIAFNATGGHTPGTVFTELAELGHTTPNQALATVWTTTSPVAKIDSTLSSSVAWGVIGLVIQPAQRYTPDDVEGQVSTAVWQ